MIAVMTALLNDGEKRHNRRSSTAAVHHRYAIGRLNRLLQQQLEAITLFLKAPSEQTRGELSYMRFPLTT